MEYLVWNGVDSHKRANMNVEGGVVYVYTGNQRFDPFPVVEIPRPEGVEQEGHDWTGMYYADGRFFLSEARAACEYGKLMKGATP